MRPSFTDSAVADGVSTYFFFSSPLTNSTLCSTVSTALPASPIVIIAGFFRYFLVRRSTGGGIVAEKSVVTRVRPLLTIVSPSTSICSPCSSPSIVSEGNLSRMKVRSASKPKFTMRSASSMTIYRHCERTMTCRSMTSLRRPGVAMMISAPERRLNCCSSTARCARSQYAIRNNVRNWDTYASDNGHTSES